MVQPTPPNPSGEQEPPASPQKKRSRMTYGLKETVSQGLGGTIGGPIFVILGYALSQARSGLLVSFLVNGILMLGFVLIFSELALSLPISGGGYSFSKEAIGGAQGFLIGWLIWVGNLLFIAISGIGFSYSLTVFFPDRLIGSTAVKIVGFLIVLFFFLFNLFYPKIVNFFLRILTFSIVGGFLVYIILGLILGGTQNPDFSGDVFTESFSFSKMLSMTSYTFVIYCVYEWNSTFENLTAAFDNIKRPRKTIPRAFILSILIAIVIYWLVAFVTLLNIGSFSSNSADVILNSDAPLADAFGLMVRHPLGIYFMGFIGMIATITSINSGLQMSSHILSSMARDGFIPKTVQKTSKNVHWVGMLISTLLALIITLTINVDIITEISNFIFLISMIFLSLSLLILRKTRPNLIRPWKIPFYPVLPIVTIVASVILMTTMFVTPLGRFGITFGVVIVLFGGIYYLIQISRRDRILLVLYGSKLGICILMLLFTLLTRLRFYGPYSSSPPPPPFLGGLQVIFYIFLSLGLLSLLADIVPVRRWFVLFTRHNQDSVVVTGITQMDSKMERSAHRTVIWVAIGEFIIAFGFFLSALLVYLGQIVPQSSLFPLDSAFFTSLFLTLCVLLGTIFFITGIVRLIAEREFLRLGTGSPTE